MPSSSARCAQLPRAADKVPFYAALKKFRDFLNGLIPHMEESECVFTEQRIRQCCESQDLNKAVTVNLGDVKQCSDDPGLASNLNIDAHQSSHMFSERNNVEGGSMETTKQVIDKLYPHLNTNISNERDEFVYSAANRIPTTAPMIAGARPDTMSDTDYMSVFESHQQQQQQPPPEKKKRGRPKKLKGQEIIDPATGNKITISGQSIPHHNFNNILNLSMITASDNSPPIVHRSAGNSNAENTTKKKRGRPKKVKPMLENMLTTSVKQVNTKPSTNLIGTQQTAPQTTLITSSMHHSLSMEHISSPQSNHQAPSLYNTPPPSHMLYTASASPMASPALNCSYSHSHGTPPVQVERNIQMNADHPVPATGTVGIRDQQPHLGETPPPSSPNMCAVVDFDPPNERTNDELETAAEAAHAHAHEHHYQQWLSPKAQQASQASPVTVSTYPQTDQQQATVQYLSSSQEQQEQHWQSYEEHSAHNSSYMLASPQQQQQQQQHHHINLNNTQQVQSQVVTDVSRKSLSGLESLVDQIPSISEQESNVVSSATAAAAAAAVENRLIGLQQQKQQELQKQRCQQQVTEPQSQSQSTTGSNNVLNSNFSVSNLVTNSSMHLLHNNNNNNSSSGRPESEENSKKNNNIIEYLSNSPHTHTHASNHLISAALVAATVGNTSQPVAGQQHHHSIAAQHPHAHTHAHPHTHTHAHAHTQMYMDHTHHITSHMAHIPPPSVNTMYAAPPYAAQHGSAAEYGHAGHYSVQGATPTLHMPSPNYPYTHYSHHTPPQSNYPSFAHAHPHHHHHGHTSHHLSVFERLKPSDISGYSGF